MEDNRKPIETVVGITEKGIKYVVLSMPKPEKVETTMSSIETEEDNE